MPPNQKGGKGYKKGKHANDGPAKLPDIDAKQGQMIGRVLKSLGDRRFRIYCNDGKERICKLRGNMRKNDYVDEGGIVLLSIRDITNATAAGSFMQNDGLGDILATIDRSLYGKLKKEPDSNPILFTSLEQVDRQELARRELAMKNGKTSAGADEDDIFDREGEEEDGVKSDTDDMSEDDEMDSEEKKKAKQRSREEKQKKRDMKIQSERDKKKDTGNDEVDIDAI
jgi:initiation factor 1A